MGARVPPGPRVPRVGFLYGGDLDPRLGTGGVSDLGEEEGEGEGEGEGKGEGKGDGESEGEGEGEGEGRG